MYKRTFDVMIPKTSKTRCFTCHHQITRAEIRISFKKYDHFRYFHLSCFDPPALYYLKPRNLKITLSKDLRATFDSWLSEWNKQFFPLDPKTPYKVKSSKVLKTKKTLQASIFSLVFKYLTINDIVNYCELVCKSFYHAAWNANLWKSLLFRDFRLKSKSKNPRLEYIQENFERCVICKLKPEHLKRSDLIERNVCKTCKKINIYPDRYVSEPLFRKIVKKSAEQSFRLFFNQKGLRLKTYDGCSTGNYFFYYLKVAERIRRENRDYFSRRINEFIPDDHEFLKIVRCFDLSLFIHQRNDEMLKGFEEKYRNQLEVAFQFIRNRDTQGFTEEEMIQNIVKTL